MKPFFTVHAGEYLVGNYIEKQYPDVNLWIPSKDTGIDLLVTNSDNTRAVSLQVKFSKDFTYDKHPDIQRGIQSLGWFTLMDKKIAESKADLWIFTLFSFSERINHFLVIPPKILLKRLREIHGRRERIQTYFWVTNKGKCWEARGLKKSDEILIANHVFKSKKRDFTKHLNNWQLLEQGLR